MKNSMKFAVCAAAMTLCISYGLAAPASAMESAAVVRDTVVTNVTDSVKILFPLNSSVLDVRFGNNPATFNALGTMLNPGGNSWSTVNGIRLVGGASPDGNARLNNNLSQRRAQSAYDYLKANYGALANVPAKTEAVGVDWQGVLELVQADPAVPFKNQTVALLQEFVSKGRTATERETNNNLARLESLKDGAPYYYLCNYLFPNVRSARVYVNYDLAKVTETEVPEPAPVVEPEPVHESEPVEETVVCKECTPFYMDINTNMLYDLAMTPNIGAEFYLGKRWSIGVDWMYAWWKNDDKAFYWRTYGGDLYLRKWIGKKAKEKPLQGHHLGLYGQMFTYDFVFGGVGHLADTWNWGVGLEYGYSLPVAPRLNIDFSIGIGYAGGESKKYDPESGHYYWTETHNVNYVGPTRASIGLIWLIGCGNYNHMGRKADK